MRPKIRCDGESWKILQNFLQLNWTQDIFAMLFPKSKASGANMDDYEAVPALGVGYEVRRPRAQAKEGPKPRYTNPQVL